MTDGAERTVDGRLARLAHAAASRRRSSASRRSRPPQPDAILELALGEHHLDRVALVLETGHDNVLERVDAPRRPRDLAGQPPQAELGRRDVEQEIEQPLEGGGGDVDAWSRRDEPVTAARARAGDPIVLQLHDRNTGDDPERQARRDVTRRRNRGRADRLRAVERDRVAQSAGTLRGPPPQRLDGLQDAGAQVPELDHERGPLLLQQVSALGRQADLQTPRDQLAAGRA